MIIMIIHIFVVIVVVALYFRMNWTVKSNFERIKWVLFWISVIIEIEQTEMNINLCWLWENEENNGFNFKFFFFAHLLVIDWKLCEDWVRINSVIHIGFSKKGPTVRNWLYIDKNLIRMRNVCLSVILEVVRVVVVVYTRAPCLNQLCHKYHKNERNLVLVALLFSSNFHKIYV